MSLNISNGGFLDQMSRISPERLRLVKAGHATAMLDGSVRSVLPKPGPLSTPGEYLTWWESHGFDYPLYVYVIQAHAESPIKIGLATDVRHRMGELQTGNPYPLRLLYVFCGSFEAEQALHRRFAAFRMCGEWFSSEGVEPHFPWFERLRDTQVTTFEGGSICPNVLRLEEFGPWEVSAIERDERKGRIKVRFIKPDPVPPEIAAARVFEYDRFGIRPMHYQPSRP